ncbi:P4B major core protein [Moumouvirus goulette]|uniref:p4B major core protein n=1 Tax=Moumouvirus goulette TaxID=1247379 RepID=M1NMR5_9VIRU|nr:P4B major core protein [Moumouvirus goulette]AGF85340.1 P4B major core protein [Moumouvirus goulette]
MSENKGRRDTFDIKDDNTNKSSANVEKILSDIENLKKKGYLTAEDYTNLYNKYGDAESLVDQAINLDQKRARKVRKQAREIAEKVFRKYNSGGKPLHEILDEMMRYKNKHKWSDAQFDEFRKELSFMLTGNRALEIDYNQNIPVNKSRINKAIGNSRVIEERGINIKESERPTLAEIIAMYEKTTPLHKTVFMHSLMYQDTSLVAMTGEYKRDRHVASNYIHPLLACMFLPKFDIFEIHMLYSNIGNIIKSRYEKKPLLNEADTLLFYDMTSDPNDVVCEINSPIADLRNRFKVQIALWETVLKLRSGNYYEAEPISEFMKTLNACRNNLYDNADLAYGQDEGALLRKLLSVFSLRPTFIYTKPINTLAAYGMGQLYPQLSMGPGGIPCPYGQGMTPFNNEPVYTITSIPMITLQLPPFTENAEPKDLRSAINQVIWINENKTIVPKEQSIIYSKEVLIFYVNRRVQRVQIRTFNNPLAFSQLPLTLSSFERLNSYPVNVPDRINLGRGEETYLLRSVVAVNETEINQGNTTTNIITGQVGLIMTHRNFEKSVFEPGYYLYDPFAASLPVRSPDSDGYFTNKPISRIEPVFTPPPETTGGIINPSFFDRASRTGTIYFYAKPEGYNPNETAISF